MHENLYNINRKQGWCHCPNYICHPNSPFALWLLNVLEQAEHLTPVLSYSCRIACTYINTGAYIFRGEQMASWLLGKY